MLWADIQAAFREMRREPWSWGATVAIIALAIASATAFFAVVDGLLLRPLPFHQPDNLASVMAPPVELSRRLTATDQSVERDRLLASSSIIARAWAEPALLVDEMSASAEGTRHYTVSPGFFDVLGAAPLMGVPPGEQDRGVEPRPAVLSHDLWQARFGGDPGILGRTVWLEGR